MNTQQPLPDIRPSPIAGKWYTANPQRLANSVDDFITQAATSPIQGRLIGLLTPHAGHRFSGPVAGHAFQHLQNMAQNMTVDVVALLGPSHHPYAAPVITSGHDAYATPLGQVPLDHALLDSLRQTMPVTAVYDDPEHALEIVLPFLQRTLGEFSLLPLALLDQSLAMARKLGHTLAALLREKKTLLVASSDLSHFYPQTVANRLDQSVMDAINTFDPEGVIRAEAQGRKVACGHGAIAAVMIAARELGADTAQVIHYATSGNVTGDYEQVVGYGAALFYQREPHPTAD